MIVLGMMSGTSVDGIDAVLMDIAGVPPALEWKILFQHHIPFPEAVRHEVFAMFRPESGTVDRLCSLNFALGKVYGQAALETIRESGYPVERIALIGNHGQTVWHIPADQPGASTLQLGEPAVIAEITGIPVVSNFRSADMAAGGHGAPLVSFMDVMLLSDDQKVRAAQNIGGIGNVTFLPPRQDNPEKNFPIAFDTGPGNMLLDYVIEQISGGAMQFDVDGKIAASGTVSQPLLKELLTHPYYAMQPPKTTGRELFGVQYGRQLLDRGRALNLPDADLAATATALTTASIARAYCDFLPSFPEEVIISGGGSKNPTLMQMLAEQLRPAKVMRIDELGIASDAKEAAAFALMAYETWHHRSGNVPSATGASHPAIMGTITWAPPRAGVSGQDERFTEARNPNTMDIDRVSTLAMLQKINDEDQKVAGAVAAVLPEIGAAVDIITARMKQGGRLISIGAGTSGRLGVLDASEVLPTFGVSAEVVTARIAGGVDALTKSIENAEDDATQGAAEIQQLGVNERDSVIGIAASGRTPYVIGALIEARKRGALTIGLACNPRAELAKECDIAILPLVGPEVVTGSTRMKAGTAQKMVLNMISTAVMIQLGKVYQNLMVDVQPNNQKLIERQRRIVAAACQISAEEAAGWLEKSGGEAKTAIVMYLTGESADTVRDVLAKVGGKIREAVDLVLGY